jgi:hypothetical protein
VFGEAGGEDEAVLQVDRSERRKTKKMRALFDTAPSLLVNKMPFGLGRNFWSLN